MNYIVSWTDKMKVILIATKVHKWYTSKFFSLIVVIASLIL